MKKNRNRDELEENLFEEIEDFSEEDMHAHDPMMEDMMDSLVEASQHQHLIALELTKLIVDKGANKNMSEEQILSAFKRASKVVADSFPFKAMLEMFN